MLSFKKFSRNYRTYIILIVIIVFGFFARLFKLSDFPPLDVDEICHGTFASHIINFGFFKYFITIPFSDSYYQGPIRLYSIIPSICFFGYSNIGLRFPFVIYGVLSILFTYFSVKNFYDKNTAILASLIVAILPTHIDASRIAIEYIIVIFFTTLGLYLLSKLQKEKKEKKKIIYLYFFFLFSGIGIISRLTYIFFLISSLICYKLFFNKKLPRMNAKNYFIMFLLLLIGLYPLIVYGVRTSFIFYKELLHSFPNTSNGINLANVSQNFLFGIFIGLPSALANFTILFLFFIIFFIYNVFTKKKLSDLFVLFNFLIITLLISILTITSFNYRDFLMLSPFFGIIFARSIKIIYDKTVIFNKIIGNFLLILILLLSIVKSYNQYVDYIVYTAKETDISKCINGLEKISDLFLKYNESKFFIENLGMTKCSLQWFLYGNAADIHQISSYINKDTLESMDYNNTFLIESSDYCRGLKRFSPNSLEEEELERLKDFKNLLNSINKSLILNKTIGSENEMFYLIYRIE